MKKVVKFGGSSLATAGQFRKVKSIIRADPSRCFIVPSAPGRRSPCDTKVTDLLYLYYDLLLSGSSCDDIRVKIQHRYEDILAGLGLKFSLDIEFDKIASDLRRGCGRDYAVSRGEYLNALILASYLNMPLIDAAEVICFDDQGRFLPEQTDYCIRNKLNGLSHAVIPGFYGALPDGTVKTFVRGGSDITGSLVARAVSADIYENWTDVSGFLIADPQIVKDPSPVAVITYRELHRLAGLGAAVLQEDAVYPARDKGIPIHIKNTNRPQDVGTYVVESTSQPPEFGIISVTGLRQECALHLITPDPGLVFQNKIINLLNIHGISARMIKAAGSELTLWVPGKAWRLNEMKLLPELRGLIHGGCYAVEGNLALLAVGCRTQTEKQKIMNRIKGTLKRMSITLKGEDLDGSEPTILLSVEDKNYERAIRAIYARFARAGASDRICINQHQKTESA